MPCEDRCTLFMTVSFHPRELLRKRTRLFGDQPKAKPVLFRSESELLTGRTEELSNPRNFQRFNCRILSEHFPSSEQAGISKPRSEKTFFRPGFVCHQIW